jgi:predicted nucleic acid-binding protein
LSRLVIDASAFVPIALAASIPAALRSIELVGPPLLWSETVSALREAAWRGVIDDTTAAAAVARVNALGITRVLDDRLPVAAFELAKRVGWAKTYDAEYVALARLLAAPLFTRDLRLHRGASRLVEFYEPT